MSEIYKTCFRRVEKKYIINRGQYEAMLKGIERYTEPDAHGQSTVCNIYYDTDFYQLIGTSLENPFYKEKLRVRSYGVPGDDDNVFIEIKKKFDGVVYKRRAVMSAKEAKEYLGDGAPPEDSQIIREIDWFMKRYDPGPKAFIGYEREAYIGKDDPNLRITFDTNLRGRSVDLDIGSGDGGSLIIPGSDTIMEIKIPDCAPIWLCQLLSENGIFPTSFSKYGTYYKQTLSGKTGGEHQKEAFIYA